MDGHVERTDRTPAAQPCSFREIADEGCLFNLALAPAQGPDSDGSFELLAARKVPVRGVPRLIQTSSGSRGRTSMIAESGLTVDVTASVLREVGLPELVNDD